MSTVSVTYLDREAVRRALDAHVRDLTVRYPDIEQIVLFGSMVAGTPVPGSDVDLLVVLKDSDRRFIDRIPAFLPTRFPVDIDVFPYTHAELERMTAEGNHFVLSALRHGVTIFTRPE